MKNPDFPICVFYDGACSVCAAEIEHYLRKDRNNRLIACDISSADFKPETYQIPLTDFMYELHVIDHSGYVYRGVEAFRAIWQAFPASTIYGLMGMIVAAPVLNRIARLLYRGFAAIRPYLPKRHACSSGSCTVAKKE
jgi:predicted DCC family thiol-disulfide oxidoreductase YuxK